MSALQASVRLFATRPGLAAAIVLTLAIGLGSVTAIFSITHALLLRPLPFPDADRVVAIHAEVADERGRLALRELRELERSATAFSKIGAYYRTQYNLTGGGPPQALTCTMPTSTMFDVLGVRALHGEVWPQALDFTRHYTVLLSHGLWQQRFGGRPDVVGQSIVLDGASYSIAGVLPDTVDFPLQTDVYRGVTDYNAQDVRRYSVIARMAAGRTLGDARDELDALSARFASSWPDTNLGVQLRAVPLRDAYVGGARPFVLLMAAAVGLLMLMAAVNVTNLLLSRALSQEGDFAVRLALGASRWHLVRQGIVEVLGVTAVGAVLGAAGARFAMDRITGLVGADLPPWMKVEVDLPTLAIGAVAAAIVAVAIAILPALQASRTDVERVLRQHAGRSGSGGRHRPRQWLVGAQAAIASLLLMTAGLFAAGLTHLMGLTPGFDARGALTFRTDPPFSRYGDIATTSEFYRRAAEALRTIPGVTAVGANTNLPFARLDVASPRVSVEGRDSGRSDESPFVNLQLIDPGYFDAMRIPLTRGRRFEPTEDESAPMAAIVSERTARRFWGAEDAIGRRLRLNWNQNGVGSGGGSELWLTVVGVVGSIRFDGVEDVSGLDVYAPHTQMFAGDSFFVVRTAADPAAIGRQVRAALDMVDRDQSFFDVATLEGRMARTLWQHRVATLVLTLFAAIALILAVLGTYAVTAHAVAAQRREVGIRRALGSSVLRLGWLVARQWAGPVATGVIMGLGAGLLAARALTTAIGVPATGMGWLVLLPAALAAAAAVACVVPVARLLNQVPLTDALRTE